MNGTITLGGGAGDSGTDISGEEGDASEDADSDSGGSDDTGEEMSEETGTAFFGVKGETVEEGTGMPEGVCVTKVYEGSGADKAGIKEGYVIVAIDGTGVETWEECAEIVQSHKPGDSVLVAMKRKPEGYDNYSNSFRTYVILGTEE